VTALACQAEKNSSTQALLGTDEWTMEYIYTGVLPIATLHGGDARSLAVTAD